MNAKQLLQKIKKQLAKFKWVKTPQLEEIAAKKDCTRQTILNYIKGNVSDMVFAEELIKELSKVPKLIKKRKDNRAA